MAAHHFFLDPVEEADHEIQRQPMPTGHLVEQLPALHLAPRIDGRLPSQRLEGTERIGPGEPMREQNAQLFIDGIDLAAKPRELGVHVVHG